MIKVTADHNGVSTEINVEIDGDSLQIGIEAAHIVTQLPKHLIENCEPSFDIMRHYVEYMKEHKLNEFQIEEGAENDKCN